MQQKEVFNKVFNFMTGCLHVFPSNQRGNVKTINRGTFNDKSEKTIAQLNSAPRNRFVGLG